MSDVMLDVGGVDVKVTNPDKVFFPDLKVTKLDLVNYYLAVMDGALIGCLNRPTMLKRHPNGVGADFFYQKRVPSPRPEWIRTVTVSFPSGRTATFLAPADAAHVIWAVNLGCLDLNPWAVRTTDVDHPDELRVDLDPTPGIDYSDVIEVAMIARAALEEHGLQGFPKTSGKRGMHIYVRIETKWDFQQVRRAALALARDIEKKAKGLATTAWWKEERHGVFVDYNQNARDRTIASVYSVRAMPDGRVSCALRWDEVPDVQPEDLTIATVPERFAKLGDPGAAINETAGSLESLLELAERQEAEGEAEAPWPPHFPKQPGEPKRVMPSRAKKPKPKRKSKPKPKAKAKPKRKPVKKRKKA